MTEEQRSEIRARAQVAAATKRAVDPLIDEQAAQLKSEMFGLIREHADTDVRLANLVRRWYQAELLRDQLEDAIGRAKRLPDERIVLDA